MNLSRAAWLAMVGGIGRALFLLAANWLPSLPAEIPLDVRFFVLVSSVLEPFAWIAYFALVAVGRRTGAAAGSVVALGILGTGWFAWWQVPTFSTLSLDTITFCFRTLAAAGWWLVVVRQTRELAAPRVVTWYLVVFSLMSLASTIYGVAGNLGTVREFGVQAPFQLIVTPSVWMLYWATQALYLRQLQLAKA